MYDQGRASVQGESGYLGAQVPLAGVSAPLTPAGLGMSATGRIAEMCQRVTEASMNLDDARRQHVAATQRLEQCQMEFSKASEALGKSVEAFRDGVNVAV